jgi:hypothetical protein
MTLDQVLEHAITNRQRKSACLLILEYVFNMNESEANKYFHNYRNVTCHNT